MQFGQWALGFGLSVVIAAAASGDEPVDYVRDIKPILRTHCEKCHGALEQSSGLRLDTARAALEGGNSGGAINPGDSAASLLIKAVTGADGITRMPPADGADPLPKETIVLLKRWIDAGAKFPKDEVPAKPAAGRADNHWSFQPIVRRPPPAVQNVSWVRNSVDAFILRELERRNIQPAPEADRVTLLRRVWFDLVGLPPPPNEVDQFLGDGRPDAYERAVDRLLASPHYGERWGRHWLDQARYADSDGYSNDSPRVMWRYRDWVIDALNRDLPFDQFAIEQLAGDLLPQAAIEQVIATGFHRNTQTYSEGDSATEEYRVESVVDRVHTTGIVFLGLTLGCARCHDHKFDPISQREFFQLYAFLNNQDEPAISVPGPEHPGLPAARREHQAAQEVLQRHQADQRQRTGRLANLGTAERARWQTLRPTELRSNGGAELSLLEDGSILISGDIPARDTYTLIFEGPVRELKAIRLEALTHPSLTNHGPGFSEGGQFVLTEFALSAAPRSSPEKGARIRIARATADRHHAGWHVSQAIDGQPHTGWANGREASDRTAFFFLAEPARIDENARLIMTLDHQHGGPRHQLGRFRISATDSPEATVERELPEWAYPLLASPLRTAEEQVRLEEAAAALDPQLNEFLARVAVTSRRVAELEKASQTTALVMRERAEPRITHIHLRGDYLAPGRHVTANVPAVLPPLPARTKSPNRLDLARWLVAPENPLTARVAVNRAWQQFFGRGLVETDDFGTQGEPPTHPELLDWLAADFQGANSWSTKSLHRLIVTSATYRQSSHARPELNDVDPRNLLLARQNRLRLEAEIIRDTTLASSGLLSQKLKGPSVFPPQPDGVSQLTQNPREWRVSEGDDRYRRGMYTFFWRLSPHPFLTLFNAPEANTTCSCRPRSNTPLQSLTLLNDAAFLEAAQALAVRVLRDSSADDSAARIRYAFQVCLSRRPTPRELAILTELLEQELEETSGVERQVLFPFLHAADAPDPRQLAAWTTVARTLLNLDEFITRE